MLAAGSGVLVQVTPGARIIWSESDSVLLGLLLLQSVQVINNFLRLAERDLRKNRHPTVVRMSLTDQTDNLGSLHTT